MGRWHSVPCGPLLLRTLPRRSSICIFCAAALRMASAWIRACLGGRLSRTSKMMLLGRKFVSNSKLENFDRHWTNACVVNQKSLQEPPPDGHAQHHNKLGRHILSDNHQLDIAPAPTSNHQPQPQHFTNPRSRFRHSAVRSKVLFLAASTLRCKSGFGRA